MKLKIIPVFAALVLLFGINVSAATPEYSVTAPKDFTVDYTENGLINVSKIMDTDTDALRDYCEQNDIVMIAVNKDNSVQMRLSVYETELSKKAKDIKSFSGDGFDKVASEITDGEYQKVNVSGVVFIKVTESLADTGGDYTSTQYLTVKNGKMYHFIGFTSGAEESPFIPDILKTLKFDETPVYSGRQKTVIVLVIAALAVLIGIMIYAIIKDLREKD